ncbi:insulinase family protein [Mesobaculum littorinae]|uniref:Insulinase family protein n=1 Tax=Mesobaculum littorinae TaxID=2486419 RepID=A0A438AHT5_9RHOB|nr:pitrilysin family protein [Mesobaculum littorinae]RVV98185.1 insulinase family protein [Mesobaculum littorinae]
MHRLLSTCFALALTAGAPGLAAAQEPPAPPAAATDATAGPSAEATTFTLANGLQVVVLEDHRAPVVVHMVWYRAGAADEQPGVSGIAHYLEHLMFKGTDELEPGELSEIVAANGGTDNAFTSQDYTAYFQRVASDRLGLMMEMEADRMRDLQLADRDILTERKVVLEERNQRIENEPGALFSEQRMAAQYLNHPYGKPVIGWRAEIEELDLDDALAFYRTYYAPNNAVLVVAGDVAPDEVRALAEEHYGPLAPTENLAPRVRPQEPPQRAERRMVYEDARIAQPYLTRSYLAPERDPGDQDRAAALTLLAAVLGGSPQTSVLGTNLQFATREALYTSAYYDGVSFDDTTFTLVVVPTPGTSLDEAEAALDREIAAFLEDGVDEEQLDRIKMQLRAGLIYAEDSAQARARRYGAALTSGLTIEDVEAWPELLQQVTGEDIVAAARDVFDRDAAVTGWLRPPEGAPAPGADAAPAALPDPAAMEETQ